MHHEKTAGYLLVLTSTYTGKAVRLDNTSKEGSFLYRYGRGDKLDMNERKEEDVGSC